MIAADMAVMKIMTVETDGMTTETIDAITDATIVGITTTIIIKTTTDIDVFDNNSGAVKSSSTIIISIFHVFFFPLAVFPVLYHIFLRLFQK